MRSHLGLALALLLVTHCAGPPPAPKRANVQLAPPASAEPAVATPAKEESTTTAPDVPPADGDDAPPPSMVVVAGLPAEAYLEHARDPRVPMGSRANALQMYARAEREANRGDEAVRTIFAMKGQIQGPLGDAAYDALPMTDAPSAIPLLLSGGALAGCDAADVPVPPLTVGMLQDPHATISLTITDTLSELAPVFALVQANPDSPEAANAVPAFIAALRCGDARVRWLAGKSIGNVHRLKPAERAALRELLGHARPHTRASAATLLALGPEPATFAALDKALADPEELVRLHAAAALVRLHRPGKARPVLQRLATSQDADVASTAAGVLKGRGARP